jgi:hypothetical protein
MDIKDLLEEAFEEGVGSPYEMKKQIVDNLYAKIETKSTCVVKTDSINELAKDIHKNIPLTVLRILEHSNTWLSGSSLLNLLIRSSSGEWSYSDWDIYCNTSILSHLDLSSFKIVNDYNISNLHYKGSLHNCKIDLIGINDLNNIQQVFDTFDINLVKIAFFLEKGKPKLVADKDCLNDLVLGQIRIKNKSIINEQTISRVLKYNKRGFRDLTGLVEQGVLCDILKQI